MSILFYRRPDYHAKSSNPLSGSECARYVERAKKSEGSIPSGLTFEDVVNNRALPPCTLSDFMDYLVYVEHDAENLQFYLWYRSYVKRFNALSDHQQRLSQPWTAERKEVPQQRHKMLTEDMAELLHKFNSTDTALLDKDIVVNDQPYAVIQDDVASVAPSIASNFEASVSGGLKWQAFTIQPFRAEINHVIRHYLAFNSPRELNLSHRDRALCLHALQHTTHPSAFLPAVTITESALRGQSHPNFIRWSICNGNRPRVILVRTNCVVAIVAGTTMAVLLVLSDRSRWLRLCAGVLWFVGIGGLIAAYKGLCVILHHSHSRMLKPWEEEDDGSVGDCDELGGVSRQSNLSPTRPSSITDSTLEFSLSTINTHKSNKSIVEKRNGWLSAFGPRNSGYGKESWTVQERKKSLVGKLFGRTVWVQDETLRVLQSRIVLGANLWAALITLVLCVVVVCLPEVGLY